MLLTILLFELRFRLRQTSTYLFFGILFLLAFLFESTDVVKMSGGSGRTLLNSPLVILTATGIFSLLGTIMVSALMGTSVYRDFETGAHELFFTTRVTKRDYLIGRFAGSYLVTVLVFTGLIWGLMIGTAMPWVDHSKLGPFQPAAYLYAFGVFLVPNLLLIGALFFIFGAITRSLLAIYIQGVALLVGYLIALSLIGTIENRTLASLVDPFGMIASRVATRYWTVEERNTLLVPLTGAFLGNRILWTAVAVAVFVGGFRLFSFQARLTGLRLTRQTAAPIRRSEPEIRAEAETARAATAAEPAAPTAQYLRLTRFYLRDTLRGTSFLIIAILGILLFVVGALQMDKLFGTPVYPVTRIMAEAVASNFMQFNLILITFLAGELVWKERVLRLFQITDALPVSTSAVFLSKMTVIALVQALLFVVLIPTAILLQAAKGYFHFEPLLYVEYLFGFALPGLIALTVLAFFVHTLVNNKFLGHTVMVVIYVCSVALPSLGLNHNLYLFSQSPTLVYSDMNGFGPFVAPSFFFTLYWWELCVVLAVVAGLFWVRGTDMPWRERYRTARARRSRMTDGIAAIGALSFVVTGAFIFLNTNVLNTYLTEKAEKHLTARYEKQYRSRYETIPQPRITDVSLAMDLFPSDRRYHMRGVYTLRNKTNRPVTELPVNLDRDLTIRSITFDRPTVKNVSDPPLGFYTYTISPALQPGETMRMTFDLAYEKRGFPNDRPNTSIAGNGSFVSDATPHLGYIAQREMTDDDDRKKEGLPPKRRMAPLTDQPARANTYITQDADWINFEATVSTDPDQIAIAPGYLQKEWQENGRRYFHYKMDAPILNFYTFLSARYAVRRDSWTNGKQTVAIEIYYHPQHTYNLDRMITGIKRSLDYYTANYSPYQFRQVRILEFPAYQTFAQSFPNTIPFSEGIGFIARVDDSKPDDIDYPFYVTSHEVAHQWWAHQVIGANVEGSEMLSESLAEYSALMVMEKQFGRSKMRRFLRYDLDQYLAGRGRDRESEEPLMRCQNQQYIHYNKGSLVFYALRDYIGENRLNAVLSAFLHDKGFQNPPYTISQELVERLRAATPPDLQYLITDMFETITLYDNRAESATYKKIGEKEYRVTLTIDSKKLRANGAGKESEIPIHDSIDIGVFAKQEGEDPGRPLRLEKRLITQAKTVLTFDVPELPSKAGIDPYNKLIDRTPDDNTIAVTPE